MNRKLLAFVLCLLSLWAYGCQKVCVPEKPEKLRGSWRRFTVSDGLLDNDVEAIAGDDRGNVWFATRRGVSVLTNEGEWVYYRAADGLGADEATDIVVDRQGRIWVATIGGGISRFDGATWYTFSSTNSRLPDERIKRLAIDAQGNVWALSLRSGLSVIHNDDTVAYIGLPFPQDPSDLPFSLEIDSRGWVWVATLSSFLAAYDPARQRWQLVERIADHVDLKPGFQHTWGIAADRRSGHLWIASGKVIEISNEEWRVYFEQFYPGGVFIDADGYKWFWGGHPRGYSLLLLSPDNRQGWFCRWEEPFGGIPYHLAWFGRVGRDAQGNYWFPTSFGAVRFTPSK